MEFALGFVIALAISLTGVGAGSMTTPLLILLLRVNAATAVGTALAFGAIVKIASAPVYVIRRQISGRVLAFLLVGGLPGVLAGSLLLDRFKHSAYESVLYAALGSLIAATAAFHLYRSFRPKPKSANRDRARWLPWFALPIGTEVGFSSAGAGALGSLLLLGFTDLTASEVVGTDLCFGLVLSLAGSLIQVSSGNYDGGLLFKLVAGGLCGVATGTFLSGRIAQRPLRICLLVMLTILGCQLALHGASIEVRTTGNNRPVRSFEPRTTGNNRPVRSFEVRTTGDNRPVRSFEPRTTGNNRPVRSFEPRTTNNNGAASSLLLTAHAAPQ